MKVFVTKYALTTGIEVKEVDHPTPDLPYVNTKEYYFQQFILGKNAFHTYADAVIAARGMRNKKQASLQKQLNKVRGLIFPSAMPDKFKTESNP